MSQITLDCRERTLRDALCNIGVCSEMQRLDIGDIEIRAHGSDIPTIVFERKTMADMESSIKDGRYKEQKFRLMNACDAHHKAYLIEGDWMAANEMAKGAIINTMFRDRLQVIVLSSVQETASFIAGCAKRVAESPSVYTRPDGMPQQSDYSACVSTSKKANMTPEAFAALSLAQIPGMSVAYAKALLANYNGSLSNLMQNYDIITARDVHVSAKRRLGDKLAKRIAVFLGKTV